MNLGGRQDSQEQFQIAPMIDIVFILLIFFVATYAAAQNEKMLDIKLPSSGAATDEARKLHEIVVNLTANGDIYVNRRKMTPEQLRTRLTRLMQFHHESGADGDAASEPGVIIRAHAECAHKYVIAVMDICKSESVGIRRVYFSTTPATESDISPDA